ncbi:MAG: PD40 domain-containing protein [Ignavibacteriae bacterium]|nr:PD40 domain-containing protein [Ignavibacteriota bacterium]
MKIRIFFLLLAIAILSCKSVPPCPEELEIGNLGTSINTGMDDHLPVVYGDTLYFTSTREESDDKELVFMSPIINGKFTYPVIDKNLPLNKFQKISSPAFYFNKQLGIEEIYFAAVNPKTKKGNRDIFVSIDSGNGWSNPIPIGFKISTENYESHPSLSADGSILLFSSDRPGGVGDVDLYISSRKNDGTWTEPVNLGKEINTPKADIAPMISPDGYLYYASKGFGGDSTYDIIKTEPVKKGIWQKPRKMKPPINTNFDESGPAIWNNYIILSSNRKGGCGGYDIYLFELCGPVTIEGEISDNGSGIPLNGRIEVSDDNENRIYEQEINESGIFTFPFEVLKKYTIKYYNNCMPNTIMEQDITTPCNDTSSVKLQVKFTLPEEQNMFQTEEFAVPFFVTGYYKPNTSDNLNGLRMKFAYNIIGVEDSTKYIEFPGPEYDELSLKVDEGITNVVENIIKSIEQLTGPCTSGKNDITIHITGYADPRTMSDFSRYFEDDIDDDDFNIHIKRGEQMTNELLSILRAYNTYQMIQSKLLDSEEYQNFQDKVKWEIEGKGIDEKPDLSDEFKRRVDIKINIK